MTKHEMFFSLEFQFSNIYFARLQSEIDAPSESDSSDVWAVVQEEF